MALVAMTTRHTVTRFEGAALVVHDDLAVPVLA